MTRLQTAVKELTSDDQRLAEMLKALGNPVRFRIVQILAQQQVCITGEIVEFTTLAQSTVSQHLKVLRDTGLIDGEVDGPATCYCLNAANIRWLKAQIDGWLPQCCQPEAVVVFKRKRRPCYNQPSRLKFI